MNKMMIAAAAATVAITPQLASAYDWIDSDRTKDGPYLSLKGGYSNLDDPSYTTGSGATSTKMDDGWMGTGAVGVRKGPMRYEIEGVYQSADVNNHTIAGTTVGGGGETQVTAAMANAYVDMGTFVGVKPYIGGGVGYANVKFKDYSTGGATFMDDDDNVFAYQGMAGVTYDLNPCWSVNAEYRYLGTNDAEVTTVGGTSTKASYDSNNVLVGLRYTF